MWQSLAAPKMTPMYDTIFANALRMVGHDMKVTDYLDTGFHNNQISPGSWQH